MIRKLGLLGAVGALALATAGCDDDAVPRVITISGTAAMGAPITLGEVRAEGANGVMSDIDLTDSNGRFSIKGIGLTAPITVRIRNGKYDHDNNPLTLPSSAPDQMVVLHTAANSTVNLTPLATLALQQATGVSARSALYGVLTDPATVPTADEIAEAAAIVRANLASVASANGITNWTDYDIFSDPFNADGTGFDAILDTVTCVATGTADTADFTVTCSGAISSFDPNIDTSGYYEPGGTGGGGGGTPVTGGGSGTITVSNATPASGNGGKVLTGATVTVDGALTRVQMEGNDFMVKAYYTTATGTVTNVSYLWGNVDFDAGLADNIVFCAGTCGATVNTVANTVTFANSALTSDSDAATLNGTVSGLNLADLGGGGGGACTGAGCQMTATYTITFGVAGVIPDQTQTFTETASGSVAGLTVAAIRTSIENEYSSATSINVSMTLDTPTHKTFRITFNSPMEGVPLTAAYVVTYDYVQI